MEGLTSDTEGRAALKHTRWYIVGVNKCQESNLRIRSPSSDLVERRVALSTEKRSVRSNERDTVQP